MRCLYERSDKLPEHAPRQRQQETHTQTEFFYISRLFNISVALDKDVINQ